MSPTPPADTVQALWQASSRRLHAWFERRTGSPQDADDLVGETFLRVQAGLGRLREHERLNGWVGAIAANVLADHRRDHGRDHGRGGSSTALEAEPALPDEDEAASLRRAAASWAEAFLDRLEPDEAALLRAVDLEGRPQSRVARELGLAPSTVRSRVQRSRVRLRGHLETCCHFAFDLRGNLTGTSRRAGSSCDCDRSA